MLTELMAQRIGLPEFFGKNTSPLV